MQLLPPGRTGGPSRLFILRPVATTLLMVAILLAGVIGYRFLPVSALPEVDYPTIQVVTLYPGASPDVVTSAITAPLERQFGQMSGLKQMSSQSSGGASVVTLQFQLTLPLDVAEQEVQAAMNAANSLLPSDLPNPPVYSKVNPADPPIMTLAVTSSAMPMTQVEDMVETRVAQKISQVSGVGLVTLSGGQRPAVRVKLNAQAIAALGLTSETIRTAIDNANVNSAKGSLDGPTRAVTLSANDQMQSAEEYRQLIVAYQNGAPIRLGDVATVEQGAENSWLGAWANKQQAIVMNVQRQPGANIIDTADSIRTLLPQLTESLPKSVTVKVLSDRTNNIRASVSDTQFELMLAIALVVMIIYLFLRNIPATIIPGVAVPLSLIGTFAVMVFLDFSINNLTLMALTIATGFVVDDAIVVLENISRHLEAGVKPLQAALQGTREVGFTVLSMSLSLVAVFLPLLLMAGLPGRLLREFAVTLSVAIGISLVISLTLTPMMCGWMLKASKPREQKRLRGFGRMLVALQQGYGKSLKWVLNHTRLVGVVLLGTIALNIWLYISIPKTFFPEQDTGVLMGGIQADQSISFQAMRGKLQDFMKIIREDPAVDNVTGFTGGSRVNSGMMFITLKPRDQRHETAQQVIDRLRKKLANEPGANLFLMAVQDIRVGGRQSNASYQYTLLSDDLAALREWEPKIRKALAALPELADVNSDQQDNGAEMALTYDRETMSRLGINVEAANSLLNNAFGQREISTIYQPMNQYKVVMEVDPRYTQDISALDKMFVINNDGKAIPLSYFASWQPANAPLSVNHQGLSAASTISFNLPVRHFRRPATPSTVR